MKHTHTHTIDFWFMKAAYCLRSPDLPVSPHLAMLGVLLGGTPAMDLILKKMAELSGST